jgi:DNA-directed RNA polymerase specialized sigma24 family protein
MNKYTELLIRCHKADAQAQRSLYDLFKSRLFGLCRRYTRNREEAQDVMQDAFIKIFKHIGDRTKRLDQVIPLELSECDQLTEDHLSHLTDQLLISMVNELPEGCRIVFNMFVVEGYSHSEIAALLHISDSTSRSQLHHAKALMKEKLKCQDMAQYYEKFA